MTSKLHQIPVQTIKISSLLHTFKPRNNHLSLCSSFTTQNHPHQFTISYHQSRISPLFPKCTLSSPKPPTTKEEAVLQAKSSLVSTLEKPLNNLKLTGKIKKVKQPRFQVEIPVVDDSASSLSQLAFEVFGNMPIKKKGSQIKIVILWPSPILAQAADRAFDSHILVQNIDMSSGIRMVPSSDVVVFMAPEASQLRIMKTVADSLNPRPVVIFNPKWGPEEAVNFGEMSSFVGSFDVVYSFMGLEVKGLLSKRKGVVFKCVKDGVLSGEQWNVMVEEEAGKLRVVSRFRARPTIEEVENVLYNLMAINSPVTKSAKFLKDLVANVTGKK